MQHGAADDPTKPFGAEEVHLVLRKVGDGRPSDRRWVVSGTRWMRPVRWEGESPGMARVVATARKVACHPSSILIRRNFWT